MNLDFLNDYKKNGFDNVQGWCSSKLFDSIELLDSVNINKKGGCLEIGVHHGKFFLLMNQVISDKYTSYAIDVFDDQKLNVDRSGKGSLSTFKYNLKSFDRHNGKNTIIIEGDSTDTSLQLVDKVGPASLRFVSVDGGHTPEHTQSDLHLALQIVCNEGVVILDDIMNTFWPGVIEGFVKFSNNSPTLVPFAIGHNKLYMCKLSYHSFYLKLFSDSKFFYKHVRFFGYDVAALAK